MATPVVHDDVDATPADTVSAPPDLVTEFRALLHGVRYEAARGCCLCSTHLEIEVIPGYDEFERRFTLQGFIIPQGSTTHEELCELDGISLIFSPLDAGTVSFFGRVGATRHSCIIVFSEARIEGVYDVTVHYKS